MHGHLNVKFVIQRSLTIKQYTYQAHVDTCYFISYILLHALVLTEESSNNGYVHLPGKRILLMGK